MNLLKGDSDFFALDVGTSSLRVVQLSGSSKTGWNLLGYGYANIDPRNTQSASPEGRQKLNEAIMTVVGQSGIKTKNIALNIPADKTFTTIVEVDNQAIEEVNRIIKYQMDQYVPMAIEDAKVDWQVLGVSPLDATKLEVLISSTAKTYGEERMEFIEALGFNVIAEEPDPIAMIRSLTPVGVSDARLIIDFGESASDIAIIFDGSPRLVRSVQGGLNALVKATSQNLGVKDDQAKQFILKFGLAEDKLEGQVVRALSNALESFVAELVKSIKFFQTKYTGITVNGILLAGYAGAIPLLPQYVEQKTGVATAQGNPWQRVNVPPEHQQQLLTVASEFAVAVGLAERSNDG